jgi:putative restriction endonuclease
MEGSLGPVESIEDVRENCDTLLAYSVSSDRELSDFSHSLIRRGTCFLPCRIHRELFFFPSRFIGYKHNNMTRHQLSEKDGRETNKFITNILNGQEPEENFDLEGEYEIFCKKLNIISSRAGSFGVARKYWPVDERVDGPSIEALDILTINSSHDISQTEKLRLVAARVGQGDFRKSLIAEWDGCAVTRTGNTDLPRASHIKPWRLCNNHERLDPKNGLLLIPNLDAALIDT